MKKNEDIDGFKDDFKKIKISTMKNSQSTIKPNRINDFLQIIKHQDIKDEKYLVRQKIFPVLVGLVILTVLFIFIPIANPLLISGCIMVYFALMAVLFLFLRDYKNISKESFDLSLKEFLQNKRARMKSWNSTPRLYSILFIIFVLGVIMMVIGNTGLNRILQTKQNIILYMAGNLVVFLIAWIIDQSRFRKRYKQKHLPLINQISELLDNLDSEKKL